MKLPVVSSLYFKSPLENLKDNNGYCCVNNFSCLVKNLLNYINPMQLERHLAIKGGDCSHSEVNCPFKPYGCSFVVSAYNL